MNPENGHTKSAAWTNVSKPKYAALWLSLILLLGFGLRVSGLIWGQAFGYGSQGDCLNAYRVAVNYANGEPRAQYIGQPNFNKHSKLPGPLWAIFCAIGLKLWGSIDGVIWAIILLNTSAIYLTYLLAARTVGFPIALWAALFMATSPVTIEYSVVVFNPVVMSFMGACLFLALWRVVQRNHSFAAFWLFFLPLMMLQFHMSGLMLIPPIIVVLLLKPARLNFLWLVAGVIAGLALYVPYFFGDMAHSWENTRGMIFGGGGGFSAEALKVFSAPPDFLINYWGPRWTNRPDEYQEMGRACFGSFDLLVALNVVSVIVAILLIAGAFFEVRRALGGFWRSSRATFARSPGMVFLTIIFVMPLMVSLMEGERFHARYCIVLLAPLFSLAAAAAVRWLSIPRVRIFFLPLLLVTLGANVWLVPAMFHFQGKCIEQGPQFIPTFQKLETVYQSLKAHAGKNQSIQVNDAVYLNVTGNKLFNGADVIPLFVYIRENETVSQFAPTSAVIYDLYSADKVHLNDPAVAYRKYGIALVARPHP
jgi:4-amino-4-deoxy-L-arabinose transferase-like glycosyltransferase